MIVVTIRPYESYEWFMFLNIMILIDITNLNCIGFLFLRFYLMKNKARMCSEILIEYVMGVFLSLILVAEHEGLNFTYSFILISIQWWQSFWSHTLIN